jgi:hypothetical protein
MCEEPIWGPHEHETERHVETEVRDLRAEIAPASGIEFGDTGFSDRMTSKGAVRGVAPGRKDGGVVSLVVDSVDLHQWPEPHAMVDMAMNKPLEYDIAVGGAYAPPNTVSQLIHGRPKAVAVSPAVASSVFLNVTNTWQAGSSERRAENIIIDNISYTYP